MNVFVVCHASAFFVCSKALSWHKSDSRVLCSLQSLTGSFMPPLLSARSPLWWVKIGLLPLVHNENNIKRKKTMAHASVVFCSIHNIPSLGHLHLCEILEQVALGGIRVTPWMFLSARPSTFIGTSHLQTVQNNGSTVKVVENNGGFTVVA